MILKPQDVLVALKLMAQREQAWSYPSLAAALDLSVGATHKSIKRLGGARLYHEQTRRPLRAALEEFLLHGVKYVFPAERGGLTRGVPTAWAAEPLKTLLALGDVPPVWPSAIGTTRGYELAPLYPSVPAAALRDPMLYELLALLDGIRGGSARERRLAEAVLCERLKALASPASVGVAAATTMAA